MLKIIFTRLFHYYKFENKRSYLQRKCNGGHCSIVTMVVHNAHIELFADLIQVIYVLQWSSYRCWDQIASNTIIMYAICMLYVDMSVSEWLYERLPWTTFGGEGNMSSLLIIKLFWGNHNKNPLKLVAKHHESVHTLGILTPYYSVLFLELILKL